MFKKFIAVSSISSLLAASLTLTAAAQTTTPTPSPSPTNEGAAACLQAATAKKTDALKAAADAFKAANGSAAEGKTGRAARKQAQEAFKTARKAAQAVFQTDRQACLATLRAMKKKERMDKRAVLKEKEMEKAKALLEKRGLKVELATQNNSGVSGTATLKTEDGKVQVKLNVKGGTVGLAEPAHIHSGSCANLGAIRWSLTPVTNGKSETKLETTFDELKAALPLAINVHKSEAEAGVYVACGDLKL